MLYKPASARDQRPVLRVGLHIREHDTLCFSGCGTHPLGASRVNSILCGVAGAASVALDPATGVAARYVGLGLVEAQDGELGTWIPACTLFGGPRAGEDNWLPEGTTAASAATEQPGDFGRDCNGAALAALSEETKPPRDFGRRRASHGAASVEAEQPGDFGRVGDFGPPTGLVYGLTESTASGSAAHLGREPVNSLLCRLGLVASPHSPEPMCFSDPRAV